MSRSLIPWIDIGEELRSQIIEKLKQYANKRGDIKMFVLYGSFLVRNFIRDIDVAIFGEKEGKDLLKLEFEIEEELVKILKLPVDVRVINEAPPWFVKEVIKSGLILKGEEIAISLYKKAIDEMEGLRIKGS